MRLRADHAGKEGLRISRHLLPLISAGILLGMAFSAPAEIVWQINKTHTASTPSGTGKAIATAQKDVAVQVCGTGVTGTVVVKQGAREATLTTTKTLPPWDSTCPSVRASARSRRLLLRL